MFYDSAHYFVKGFYNILYFVIMLHVHNMCPISFTYALTTQLVIIAEAVQS